MFTLESLLKTQQDQQEQYQKLKEYFKTLPMPKPPSLIPIETSARTRIYNRQPNLPVSTWNIDYEIMKKSDEIGAIDIMTIPKNLSESKTEQTAKFLNYIREFQKSERPKRPSTTKSDDGFASRPSSRTSDRLVIDDSSDTEDKTTQKISDFDLLVEELLDTSNPLDESEVFDDDFLQPKFKTPIGNLPPKLQKKRYHSREDHRVAKKPMYS